MTEEERMKLLAQLKAKRDKLIASMNVRQVVSEGLFGNGESREEYENRIMNTPEAWTGARLS